MKKDINKIFEKIYTPQVISKKRRLKEQNKIEESVKFEFGLYLRFLRESAGITQNAAANHLRIKRTTWTKYESGENLPPRERIDEIAELLKIDPQNLLLRAGYSGYAPLWDEEEKEVTRRLGEALKNSDTKDEFLFAAQLILIEYQQQSVIETHEDHLRKELLAAGKSRYINISMGNLMTFLNDFSDDEQLKLARKILLKLEEKNPGNKEIKKNLEMVEDLFAEYEGYRELGMDV